MLCAFRYCGGHEKKKMIVIQRKHEYYIGIFTGFLNTLQDYLS